MSLQLEIGTNAVNTDLYFLASYNKVTCRNSILRFWISRDLAYTRKIWFLKNVSFARPDFDEFSYT